MKQQQQQADHWARISAFGWYARRIHNTALQKYMGGAGKDMYNEIRRILDSTLQELEDLTSKRDEVCWPPYCEDNMGNCVPCPENGPTTTQGELSEPA